LPGAIDDEERGRVLPDHTVRHRETGVLVRVVPTGLGEAIHRLTQLSFDEGAAPLIRRPRCAPLPPSNCFLLVRSPRTDEPIGWLKALWNWLYGSGYHSDLRFSWCLTFDMSGGWKQASLLEDVRSMEGLAK
jgi:hypothetical protein